MGDINMDNTTPRAGMEPTSIAPNVTAPPTPICLRGFLPEKKSAQYYTHPPGIVSIVMLTIK